MLIITITIIIIIIIIIMFENWINKENSSCTVIFSSLQFDSRGKQFGSNILTRVQLTGQNHT